ncbi:vacuolar segregation pep7 [Trichoderma cornu-damae]|uniref:Vacuolar segregation pep7 n=1 Tax=Trichoderma cornu-damae TaxID=654480 RepID=A0A9P8U021_9HYPO|nr:vacuolar segregation pep7 [Trichoderma cornu-damae]
MSGRRLGGGRILGSGKGLGPTPPAMPRASSPFAPSESTVSLASSSISPPASGSLADLSQDIGSSISVGAQPKGSVADASSLVCPICSEEMVTLLQLNRHIDDNHRELPAEEQNEVKTWFDKQVLKAKRFQPLSMINMKLRGLDVFESNESNPVVPPPPAATVSTSKLPMETPIDPEELITRSHWQRSTAYDACTDPACGKGLGPINGSVNCRKCGRLFCEQHTMYQMKLSRSANHEPVRGYWARVCETCYKSREGYNDHGGASIDHTDMFKAIRRNKVERQNLEVSRLEKRLTKLTRLLANSPEALANASNGSLLAPVQSLTGQKNPRKLIEQSVVTWEEDDKVPECPFCHQEFGSWTFRRHHCRICGRVVCGDPQTGCSSEVSLSIAGQKPPSSTRSVHVAVDIRMCKDCNGTIFSGRDFAASLAHRPPDQRAYETLRQFERGIRLLLPSFHRTLVTLQPEVKENGEIDLNKPPPTHAQIQEAGKIRKRLIDSFTKYGSAAKRLRDLKADNPTQQRLQAAVYAAASSFLHTNMLPLKNLPQLLRHRSTPSTSSSHSQFLASTNHSTSSLRHSELAESENASQAPSEAGTVVSLLEAEEKDLKERLAVLEEQKFMVEEMIKSATSARRFEEVSALSRNLDELNSEIQGLRKRIGDVEKKWEAAYRNGS